MYTDEVDSEADMDIGDQDNRSDIVAEESSTSSDVMLWGIFAGLLFCSLQQTF